jgi:predicted ATPase
MQFEPVKRLEIQNYGCVRELALELTPLHALIGPNDSGKSTVLRALRTAMQFAASSFQRNSDGEWRPFEPMIQAGVSVRVSYADAQSYMIRARSENDLEEVVGLPDGVPLEQRRRDWNDPGLVRALNDSSGIWLRDRMSTATMVRFEPDYLREPARLIPERRPLAFADERGRGLASVFDAIVNRDVAAFLQIQTETKRLFPTVQKIRLSNTDNAHKVIALELVDGTAVEAHAMSEGLLYYLAFSALRYIDGSRVFLIEEPENGLHPARIADVMAVLREISKTSQVLIATHSPLVLNELTGDEVTVLTRDNAGTHATRIKDTPNFEERSQVYALGELWVSYANGADESPLLTGGART